MARRTKYQQLAVAYDKGVKDCNNYQAKCRDFVTDLKCSLIEYLNCPETKIYMFQPTMGLQVKDRSFKGDAFDIEFGEDGKAAIGFAVNVNDQDLKDKFFSFLVIFKKKGENFEFMFDDKKKFLSSPEGIEEFCEHLFNEAQQNLLQRLENFLSSPEDTEKPIGFQMAK
ncbi:MAG: hypothetical protein GX221_06235 [Candidatus Riflebacteria bacterium]|nr:hypothetical protein [Candidatus Riflebacteria bacterium]